MNDAFAGFADRVIYWTQGEKVKNFGDVLTECLIDQLLIAPIFQADRYRLIGSALDEALLAEDLRRLGNPHATLACWGCGARSERPLSIELRQRVFLFGVRGPLSRDALGLPADTPIGDPGLLVPLIYHPTEMPEMLGRTLCVPHFHEPLSNLQLHEKTGADQILRPQVTSSSEAQRLIDAIFSADFVLAGSLHAAIIACAYNRPFAFMNAGYLDTPFKWRDFAASINLQAEFFESVETGRCFAEAHDGQVTLPPLSPLLGCCPWAVRPSMLVAALLRDMGIVPDTDQSSRDLIAAASSLAQSKKPFALNAQRSARAIRDAIEGRAPPSGQRERVALLAERFATRASELSQDLVAEAAAARFRFFDVDSAPAILSFARAKAGATMLSGQWSAPNDIAPVSTGGFSRITLPQETGWPEGRYLVISGHLFAPHCAPYQGKRRMIIHLNGVAAFDEILDNPTEGESFTATIKLAIPEIVRQQSGCLDIDFGFDVLASPKEIGLRDDDRLVGYAPLRMWIEL